MKASKLIRARGSENGVIVLEGFERNKIRYIGSSIAKSVPCDNEVNSVAFSLKEGDKGFIAVSVLTPNGKNTEVFVFFLKIEWDEIDERPLLDLDSQWVPKFPERLGVITYYGIKTEIDGLIFSSHKNDKKPGMRYVGDHNLLCKYLAGDIEADAVEKAATERIDEENARLKLSELEKEIQKLTAFIGEQDKLLTKKDALLLKKDEEITASFKEELWIDKKLNAALKVIDEAEKLWFKGSSLKKALEEYALQEYKEAMWP